LEKEAGIPHEALPMDCESCHFEQRRHEGENGRSSDPVGKYGRKEADDGNIDGEETDQSSDMPVQRSSLN